MSQDSQWNLPQQNRNVAFWQSFYENLPDFWQLICRKLSETRRKRALDHAQSFPNCRIANLFAIPFEMEADCFAGVLRGNRGPYGADRLAWLFPTGTCDPRHSDGYVDIEVLACLTPLYDIERFGIINTGNPKHADILLITGSVNSQNESVVKQIYEQMTEPKVVCAIGICACNGGVFKDCYNVLGGVDKAIPVDIYVPGCAARPQAIIDGVVKSLDLLKEKSEKLKEKRRQVKEALKDE